MTGLHRFISRESVTAAAFAALLVLSAPIAASAASSVVAITHASQPVFPGETLVLQGAGFTPDCVVNVTVVSSSCIPAGCASLALTPVAGQVSDWSLKATLPASLPVGAYSIGVTCPGGATAAPALVNAAAPWWHQGDVGTAATAGGWLRVSGPALALLPPAGTVAALQREIREVRDAMTAPGMGADEAWGAASALASLATQLLSLRAQLAAATLPRVTLRLMPVGGGAPLYVPADATTASAYSARFDLPLSLPQGEYAVAVANGFGADSDPAGPAGAGAFVDSVFFESASRPAVGTIPVQAPKAWPPAVFPVTSTADPCILPCPTSDDGLNAALAAAAAAGGGIVALAPGRFYLSRPVVLPPNTLLTGAGANATSVWFTEWTNSSNAPVNLFFMNDSAAVAAGATTAPAWGAAPAGAGVASWGLADFTLYITGAVQNVLYVSNRTDGFRLTGARFRVNPYTFTWGPFSGSRGRVINETVLGFGNVIDLHSVNNVLTGNDIWGIGILMNSCSNLGNPADANNWPNYRRGHQYSYIADNVLWGGQATHYMQLWRQVIFERNVILGATEAAGGQSLGTGPMGGMAQHILHADNVIRFTWGGDREVITYDDAGGSYYGALAAVDGTTVTLANDAWPASDWEMGGWLGAQVYVINGTGATQTRRVVLPGVNTTTSPNNRTWVLSEPFAVTPDVGTGGSWVQIMPFRGRNIFHRDYNVDTGPHQIYGHGVENIVSEVKFERVRALIGWGQWRGWIPPPPAGSDFWEADGSWPSWAREAIAQGHGGESVAGALSSGPLGGVIGNGIQPNVRTSYRGNVFLEKEHLFNYGANQTGSIEYFEGASHVLYSSGYVSNVTSTPHPLHIGITYRGETTPGGFLLGGDDADVLIEGATVTAGEQGSCFKVSQRSALVLIVGETCNLAPSDSDFSYLSMYASGKAHS